MNLFGKSSLDKLSSPDHLNQRMQVVTFNGWMALATMGVLVLCIVWWACFGSIPVIVEGKGIIFDPDRTVLVRSEIEGSVEQLYVKSGDQVEQGKELMSLKNLHISSQLLEKQTLIKALENFIQSNHALEINEKNEIQKQLLVEKAHLEALEFEKEKEKIIAPQSGEVVNVNISLEGTVVPNTVLVWMEGPRINDQPQKIYAVFQAKNGELIQKEMEVEIALESVDREKYGQLFGKVTRIIPYLTSFDQGPFRRLPSKHLREYLSNEEAQGGVIIEIEPDENKDTISGYRWSTKEGPPFPLSEGSIGTVKVVLERKRPISYLIPTVSNPGKNHGK